MKILFTSDWQCRVDNLDRCRLIVNQIVDYIRPIPKSVIVVHLGDIKDAMNPVDQRVTNFIMEAVDRISREASAFLFVRGNHDSIATQDGVPSCIPVVNARGNVAVADAAEEIIDIYGEAVVWMVPYFRNSQKQKQVFQAAAAEARKKKHRNKFRVLAFHNEVSGCERNAHSMGTGITLEEIDAGAYDFCAGGHIHRPQVVFGPPGPSAGRGRPVGLGNPAGRNLGLRKGLEKAIHGSVYYAGSPFPVDWGEVNEEKSFLVLDVESGAVERIPSVAPGWYDPDAPGFRPPKSWKGTRVRVHVSPAGLAEAKRCLEKKYSGASLVVLPKLTAPAAVEQIDLRGGDAEILKRYLIQRGVPKDFTSGQMEAFIRKHLPDGGAVGVQGIRFGKVKAVNALCFESANLDFDQKGMTLITGVNHDWPGSNGSGKSSLVSLPFLALCGKTFKGQTFDAWAGSGNDRPAQIIQHIILSDGRKLKIIRGRRPGSLRVYLDGVEISMGKPEATQNAVEQLTNLPWNVLTNAVYIGQREVGSVFGTEKERKELFSRLLGLERFLIASEKIRKICLRCKRAVEEKEQETAEAEAVEQETAGGLSEIEAVFASAAKVSDDDLRQLRLRRESLISVKQAAQKTVDSLSAWMAVNQKDFETALFRKTDIEIKIDRLEEEQKLISGLMGNCPTCGTWVDVRRMEKRVQSLQGKRDELEVEWEKYSALTAANRELRKLKFEEQDAAREKYQALADELISLATDEQRIQEQLNTRAMLEKILKQKRDRLNVLRKIRVIHERARAACALEQRFIEECLAVIGRDGLPAYLATITAPALNAAALEYSEIFSDGKIGVEFKISGGDIDIKIRNECGGAEFQDQSAGESRMAGIVTAFAFRDVLVHHNILILDEPGEGLDAVNAAAFARGLKKVIGRFEHVLVVTHSPYILAELEPDRIWEVEKRNGIAEVKEI